MFALKSPLAVVTVSQFLNDEDHDVGKASGNPTRTLAFVAVDASGQRVPGAPVAVATLTGDAYNAAAKWTTERELYEIVLRLAQDRTPGCVVTGVDLAKVAGQSSGRFFTTAPHGCHTNHKLIQRKYVQYS